MVNYFPLRKKESQLEFYFVFSITAKQLEENLGRYSILAIRIWYWQIFLWVLEWFPFHSLRNQTIAIKIDNNNNNNNCPCYSNKDHKLFSETDLIESNRFEFNLCFCEQRIQLDSRKIFKFKKPIMNNLEQNHNLDMNDSFDLEFFFWLDLGVASQRRFYSMITEIREEKKSE